ncbi:MAG: hypothetical protein JXR30_00995, partial [Alphaproteobacteria bacterium]|nr:hypothetical protein [Alphaproteobacteria bacterium]
MKDKFDSFLKKYNITGRVAVAVSGGADSMALSWLCHKHSSLSLLGLTVDHRLRSESQKEAESVQNIFSKWGVPHRILTWENPSQKSLEEEARFARYELLVEACQKEEIKTLFVAHHQGD